MSLHVLTKAGEMILVSDLGETQVAYNLTLIFPLILLYCTLQLLIAAKFMGNPGKNYDNLALPFAMWPFPALLQ